ncbi:surface lipoprotein assembly modifier [Shewanella metallivivens]|uniref:Surface lipoprotein assembly modifier n=1 Tax=Shewanella metallivivens TaxID=2872342 RepID=A0ABT5TUD9_9GAMM|nr:surface lipoprotein assembly modifier [Shewanella metallivivens]MDD8061051.1 surface lipoprotein assembly modifier [Shewanella metallivivens]
MALFNRNTAFSTAIVLASASPLLWVNVWANDNADSWSLSGKAKAGMEYQSNVNISELEQASGQSDNAVVLDAQLDLGWQVSDNLRIDTGYSINDKSYQTASDYNSRLQLAFADVSYALTTTTIGTNVYHAQADLDGSDFLTLTQFSVYTMHSLSDSWFLRPSLVHADKQFDQIEQRDAKSYSATVDSFWFFDQGQRFISLGATYEDEEANATEFSYTATGLNARVSNQFSLWQLTQKLQFGLKLSQRDYQVQDDGSRRDDVHQQYDARWEVNLGQHWAVLTSVEYGDFQSTLSTADYDETRAGLLLQASF